MTYNQTHTQSTLSLAQNRNTNHKMIGTKMILFLIFTFFFFNYSSATSYNVQDYGADPSGKSECSAAFLHAWADACSTTEPATIYVPQGKYALGKTVFKGDSSCNNAITIKIDGTLSLARSAYYQIADENKWIVFENVTGVTILDGRLSGHGKYLWYHKASGNSLPLGATSLSIYNSQDVTIDGLTSKNSQMFHMTINGCQNVNLHNIKIFAPRNSPNTDGIHIAGSSDVTILNSYIATGDDCVSIGPGTANVLIKKASCGPGHGISIGSLGWSSQEEGVENVTVKHVTFTGTQNGVRIKTRKIDTNSYVTNVRFQDIIVDEASNPIIIDQSYCPHNDGCPNEVSGVKISDITYQDIHGTSASQVAVKLDCSKEEHCSGIKFDEVKLTYHGQSAMATCNSADIQISGDVLPTC